MGLFDDGDKTEPATGRKRGEARRGGNIAKSNDLNVAVLLLAVFSVIYFIGLPSVKKISRMMTDILGRMADFRGEQLEVTSMFADIVVATTPHMAVSDRKGNFSLSNVPAGDYTVTVIYGDKQIERVVEITDAGGPLIVEGATATR